MPPEHVDDVRTRIALPALLAVLVAIGMTWPLVLHLGSEIPQDLGDPLFDSWQVAWMGHAALHQPLHWFQANRVWPEHDSLAFTDVMIGYTPAGLIAARSPHAALVIHNVLFIFAYALAFLGAYLLAVELGASRLGATVAGAAFAYAPWRLAQNGHLQVVSSGGIPLALFLLVRGYRRRSSRTIFLGWLATAWQMTLGFTYGIPLTYLLGALAAIAFVAWAAGGRPTIPRSPAYATVAGICVFALVAVLQARPYQRVLDAHPEAKRTPAEVALYSPPPRGYLAAPEQSFLWGGATEGKRKTLRAPVEQTIFPGVAVLVLALLGLASRAYSGGVRIGLLVGVVVWGVLALGLPHYPDADRGFTPYRLLYDVAPGWNGMRTPGRLTTFTSLGLALLAAAGLTLVLRAVALAWRRRGGGSVAALLAAGSLSGVVLLEGFGPIPHLRVPAVPAGQALAPTPQLHLPTDDVTDLRYAYWTIGAFPKIANGGGSFDPTSLFELRQAVAGFPDERSVAYLRRLGVRSVVLHPDLTYGTAWQNASSKPTDGLPLTRDDVGGVVLYDLKPTG